MKVLGSRLEGPQKREFLIVEMSDEEWDKIAEVRSKQQATNQWAEEFKRGVERLELGGYAGNALLRAVNAHPTSFVDEYNRLLPFETWARQVYRNYLADPRRGRYRLPRARFHLFDKVCYAQLIAALHKRYGDETP